MNFYISEDSTLSTKEDNLYVCECLPSLFLFRSISQSWWSFIENLEENNANEGDRFLVRRYMSMYRGKSVITDYITTRVNYDTKYGKWTHHTVSYYESCNSPYIYDYDRYNNRDYYLSGSVDDMRICLDKIPNNSIKV